MKLVTIRITGYVQGVGFRWLARKAAYRYGIKGFVKNNDDGSVTIEAEGTNEQIESFVAWCKSSNTAGRVDHLEILEGKMKFHSTFEIIS